MERSDYEDYFFDTKVFTQLFNDVKTQVKPPKLYNSTRILGENIFIQHQPLEILVGISATMCHSAEKIPAKEGCQYTRVST